MERFGAVPQWRPGGSGHRAAEPPNRRPECGFARVVETDPDFAFAPEGIAVNPYSGTLYVADSGNHRVLRYPRPVAQGGRIVPDGVIGQQDFTSADSALVNAQSLKNPNGVAIGPNGDLYVADSGNNRGAEYAAGAGNGAAAVRVFGQPGMTSSIKPSQFSAQTLSGPQGIAVDQGSNLYVADTGANRILIFPNTQNAPLSGMTAAFVLGQQDFGERRDGGIEGADGCCGGQRGNYLCGRSRQ